MIFMATGIPNFDVKTRIFRAVAKNKKTAKLLLFSGFFVVRSQGLVESQRLS